MHRIKYQSISVFPKLAWVTMMDEQQDYIAVYHGEYVDCHDQWFIEGIWDGPFDDGNFHQADLIFGSGMRMDGEKTMFVSSSSHAERLYYAFHQHKFLVSNSLPCLVSCTDIELDPARDYASFFQSIEGGFGKHEKEVPVRDGCDKIFNIIGDNLVYSSGKVSIEAKTKKQHFFDFKSLKNFFQETFLQLKKNWESPLRNNALLTFSTISTGYDSAVISYFVAQAGCHQFFTCVSSNMVGITCLVNEKKIKDDGSHIAGFMGGECIKFDQQDFKRDLTNEVYLFPGMPYTRLTNFLPMINHLDRLDKPSILFTGIGGDYAWGSDPKDRDYYDYGVISLSEIRLKTGFIHCSFLSWLSQFRPLLLEISRSEDMKQWSIKSDYNRPIPRRMLEEAGIPRKDFGYFKKGGWKLWRIPNRPFHPQLQQEYYNFLLMNNLCSKFKITCYPVASLLFWVKLILWENGIIRGHFNDVKLPFANIAHSTFPWAVRKIADEYRETLQSARVSIDKYA